MFEHIDYISMPLERLKERGLELVRLNQIPSNPEREHRLSTEMTLICFELVTRTNQLEAYMAGEDVEIEL